MMCISIVFHSYLIDCVTSFKMFGDFLCHLLGSKNRLIVSMSLNTKKKQTTRYKDDTGKGIICAVVLIVKRYDEGIVI